LSKQESDFMIESRISVINQKILTCKLCRLSEERTNAVPGVGKILGLEVMFVGEGPGRYEDLEGLPFVGAGGKLLDTILKQVNLDRSRVYITNIVKCRPPNNRKPLDDEIEICTSNYLEKQIELLKPKLVCTLGATALQYFTGESTMGALHGKLIRSRKGLNILPIHHPAAVFRNRSLQELIEQDVKKIPKILEKIKKEERSRNVDISRYFTF
jgi:uracil-DNA glycosylase